MEKYDHASGAVAIPACMHQGSTQGDRYNASKFTHNLTLNFTYIALLIQGESFNSCKFRFVVNEQIAR